MAEIDDYSYGLWKSNIEHSAFPRLRQEYDGGEELFEEWKRGGSEEKLRSAYLLLSDARERGRVRRAFLAEGGTEESRLELLDVDSLLSSLEELIRDIEGIGVVTGEAAEYIASFQLRPEGDEPYEAKTPTTTALAIKEP